MNKVQLRLMGMSLVFQVFGHKQMYWTDERFDLQDEIIIRYSINCIVVEIFQSGHTALADYMVKDTDWCSDTDFFSFYRK